jgi:hypothetical protein
LIVAGTEDLIDDIYVWGGRRKSVSDLDPVGVVGLGRLGCEGFGFLPGGADLGGCSVGEPAVRAVVVVVDVGGDGVAWVVEGLEFAAPDEPVLEASEPGFDEGLALGVAVAAAPVRDPTGGEVACGTRVR